ncbi:hypothetical protein ACFSO7_03595 [Bacillus sp. CGMCC 1.16607]|uniref:hypothetical protein n=1 Tax=Bacillus sp. CGMCC 1.16607 TaxID=3351842 RepID=UPI00363BB10B
MSICHLCNGFNEIKLKCQCGSEMVDCGRVMDYYDDYSAYMEIDQLKLEDGYPNTFSDEKCPHLFTCSNCALDNVIFINE